MLSRYHVYNVCLPDWIRVIFENIHFYYKIIYSQLTRLQAGKRNLLNNKNYKILLDTNSKTKKITAY